MGWEENRESRQHIGNRRGTLRMCVEGVEWYTGNGHVKIIKKRHIRKGKDTSEACKLTCNYGNYFQFTFLGAFRCFKYFSGALKRSFVHTFHLIPYQPARSEQRRSLLADFALGVNPPVREHSPSSPHC